jgi:hypothetical protein
VLNSIAVRYIPAFQGVVLAHSNLHFLDANAVINGDCPFSICKVGFDATVWSPRVAMKLGVYILSKAITRLKLYWHCSWPSEFMLP